MITSTHAQTISETNAATQPGRLFVVSGPSGVGKDALLDKLFSRMVGIARSVSATTRPARAGEQEGVDYYFLSREQFRADIEAGLFLEYAVYGENLYGTPRKRIEELRSQGIDVVLKIEVQGAQSVRRIASDAILIFVQPPSLAELERRLRGRGSDSEARIAERLAIAHAEMQAISNYDYLITNDSLETATATLCAIIVAERHRIAPR